MQLSFLKWFLQFWATLGLSLKSKGKTGGQITSLVTFPLAILNFFQIWTIQIVWIFLLAGTKI